LTDRGNRFIYLMALSQLLTLYVDKENDGVGRM